MPVTRFIDAQANLDLLANGISFTRTKSRDLILQYLGRQAAVRGMRRKRRQETGDRSQEIKDWSCRFSPSLSLSVSPSHSPADDFFSQVLAQQLGAENLFRITITSFLDAYNFDVRRRDEVLHASCAAERACDSVLCVQRALSRRPCAAAGVG